MILASHAHHPAILSCIPTLMDPSWMSWYAQHKLYKLNDLLVTVAHGKYNCVIFSQFDSENWVLGVRKSWKVMVSYKHAKIEL
jgi:hypothetical protein